MIDKTELEKDMEHARLSIQHEKNLLRALIEKSGLSVKTYNQIVLELSKKYPATVLQKKLIAMLRAIEN